MSSRPDSACFFALFPPGRPVAFSLPQVHVLLRILRMACETVWLRDSRVYTDADTGAESDAEKVVIPPFGHRWLFHRF